MSAPQVARPTMVDPTTLVLGDNVRRTVRVDTEFKRDVAARGVRQPIEVRYDAVGNLTVVTGQRRTLAAIEARLAEVPVVLVDDIADEADRIVEQLGENHHRAGLTTADDAAAIKQLALFGLSSAQIAKRTQRPKDEITAALALADADEASKASVVEHDVDLVTAAKILGVATGRPDVAAELVTVATEQPTKIDHAIEQKRRQIAIEDTIAARIAELKAQGVTVLDTFPSYDDTSFARLSELTDKPSDKGSAPEVDASAHQQTCPGHRVWIGRRSTWDDEIVTVAFCEDWKKRGHSPRYPRVTSASSAPADPEAAKGERRRVIENNKASDAAQAVRRQWITDLLQRQQLPADAVEYAATMIARFPAFVSDYTARGVLDEIWPTKGRKVETVDAPGKTESVRALLAIACSIGESGLPRDFWRNPTKEYGGRERARGVRHLERLHQWGYPLADVESEWLDPKSTKKGG